MTGFLSAFLSCDAREMCQVTPALLRNYLAWLAVVFRLVTLWAGMSVNWFERVTADFYWASRQNEAGYLAFELLRSEADEIHDAWIHHKLTDPDARGGCQELAIRVRQWDDENRYDVGLFSSEFWRSDDECPPFRSFNGRRAMFESQEDTAGHSLVCNYLVFTL